MTHSFVTCDWCGEIPTAAEGEVTHREVQLFNKLYDMCLGCIASLQKKLEGAGRDVNQSDGTPPNTPSDLYNMPLSQLQELVSYNFTYGSSLTGGSATAIGTPYTEPDVFSQIAQNTGASTP